MKYFQLLVILIAGLAEASGQNDSLRFINNDLKNTCEVNEIPYNIKSHSFRINMISNLLKVTTVQHAAQIIGHNDIQSTMSYQRYPLSKQEIQDLLEDIEFVKQSIGHQKLDTTVAYVTNLSDQERQDRIANI